MRSSRQILILLLGFLSTQISVAQNVLASEEFEGDNISEVVIRNTFCDVNLEGGSKLHFKGIIEGRGDEGDFEILTELDGDRLEIVVRSRTRNWNWNKISRSRLDLKVPAGTEIFIESTSGDTYGRSLSGSEIEIEATSGDVDLSDISADVRIDVTSGDIEIEDMTGRLEIESTSGDLDLDDIDGDIRTRSTSGDVEIRQFNGNIQSRTTSGELNVSRGKGALTLRTSSGDIEGYDLEITDDLYLEASSGEIEIELVNDIEDLNFELESNSGDLRAGRRSGEKDLYIKRGDGFWVRGVTTSGDIEVSN